MKVNCLHCGHNFSLDDAYDDYQGFVRCSTCGGLLNVHTANGAVRSVMPGNFAQPAPAPMPAPASASHVQPAAPQVQAAPPAVAQSQEATDAKQAIDSLIDEVESIVAPAEPAPVEAQPAAPAPRRGFSRKAKAV